MNVWGTSCPRVTKREDAVDVGVSTRFNKAGLGKSATLKTAGEAFVYENEDVG